MPTDPSTSPYVPSRQRHRTASAHPTRPPTGQPLYVCVLGTRMVVTDLPEGLRVRLAELLRPFLVASDPSDTAGVEDSPVYSFFATRDEAEGLWNIWGNGKHLQGIPTDEALLEQLEWRIISVGQERVAGCGIFHAGALARGAATVLLQGESGAGKTTLTLGLIARGWLPLSDDAAIVDVRTLGVRVFPRCFHVEHARQRPVGARPRLERIAGIAGHARPLRWAAEGRHVSAIITVARDPEQPSGLTSLLQAEAAGALMQGAIATRLTGSQLTDLAARVAAETRYCGHLNNSNLADSLDLIESACIQAAGG